MVVVHIIDFIKNPQLKIIKLGIAITGENYCSANLHKILKLFI